MTYKELDEFLYHETHSETWHILHPNELSPAYANIPIHTIDNQMVYYFDFKNTLLNEDIALIKETRYTTIPFHFHKDMEMNYVYEGSCQFTINGQNIFLKKGDVCILGSGVIHNAGYKGANDIVINIVFQRSFFTSQFFSQAPDQSIVMQFLLDSLSLEHQNNKFLIFHTKEREQFHTALQSIICTYFNKGKLYKELLNSYIRIIFLELLNTVHDSALSNYRHQNKDNIFQILNYIETNCSHCTLTQTADFYGYHPNYLSNFIKKKTGSTFSQLKLHQQLIIARDLILHSTLPIYEIVETTGFSNQTFFFKKFQEQYHNLPSELRRFREL